MNENLSSSSLLFSVLSGEIELMLQGEVTSSGSTLDDVIRSGVEHLDSKIGLYAPDEESYETFGLLFDPIISIYHGNDLTQRYEDSGLGVISETSPPEDNYNIIKSTRLRIARNLAGFPFPSSASEAERKEIESEIIRVLSTLQGNLAGDYHPLSTMRQQDRQRLKAAHLLFDDDDKFLRSAGTYRDWPKSRGIFISDSEEFAVWVNEEDHLRFISLRVGNFICEAYCQLVEGYNELSSALPFSHSERLGYLSSCPTNLGTGLRASYHLELPKVSKSEKLDELCAELGLSVRGPQGENSPIGSDIIDVSNQVRLGVTESDILQLVNDGVSQLIKKEMI